MGDQIILYPDAKFVKKIVDIKSKKTFKKKFFDQKTYKTRWDPYELQKRTERI